jgi:hypothetical protein
LISALFFSLHYGILVGNNKTFDTTVTLPQKIVRTIRSRRTYRSGIGAGLMRVRTAFVGSTDCADQQPAM